MRPVLKGKNAIAIGLLTALTIIWGSSFILMKLAMFDASGKVLLSANQVAGLRIGIAFLVLFPFALYHFKKIPLQKLLPIAGVGVFGNGIPAFLFTASEEGISSSLAGMLNATTPIFTVLLGIAFFKLKLKPVNILGVVLGFIGAAGLMLAKGWQDLNAEFYYIGLVLMATFCYGISVNLIRYYLVGINPVAIASVSFTFIGIPAMIWLGYNGTFFEITESQEKTSALLYVAILAIMGTALAVVMFNYLVNLTNAVFASTVTYLMPIMAILWGIWLHEYFTWWYLVSIVVILVGVYLINKK